MFAVPQLVSRVFTYDTYDPRLIHSCLGIIWLFKEQNSNSDYFTTATIIMKKESLKIRLIINSWQEYPVCFGILVNLVLSKKHI